VSSGWSIYRYFVGCFIKNHINQVFTFFIFFSEDVFGDINQVAAQLAFVPFGKGCCQLFIRKRQPTFQ
jgi:hypothetical protein